MIVGEIYTPGQRVDFFGLQTTGQTPLWKTCPPLNTDDVTLMLFTPKHRVSPSIIVRRQDIESNVRWIIPGWTTPVNSTYVQDMKNAFIDKYNCSVIVVDWQTLSLVKLNKPY